MAQLAVAWVLQNPNVAAAIIGASRPEQVAENVKASGVVIPAELLARIDKMLGDSVVDDPAETRPERARPSLTSNGQTVTASGSGTGSARRDGEPRQEDVHERSDRQRVGEGRRGRTCRRAPSRR